MNTTLLAEGTDIASLVQAESMMPEGSHGQLLVYADPAPSQEAIAAVQQKLLEGGISLTGPVTFDSASGALVIPFQKTTIPVQEGQIGMSPLQYIGLGVGALVLFGSMIFAWQLTQSLGGGGLAGVWVILGILGLILFIKSAEGKAVIKAGYEGAKHVGRVYTERRLFIDRPTQKDIAKAVSDYHVEQARQSSTAGTRYAGQAGASATGYSGRPQSYTGGGDDIESEDQ